MRVDTVWAQLESDMAWRQAEIRALKNLHTATIKESDRMHIRRAMLVMLYAHTEGFCKNTFTTYVSAINQAKVCCSDVIEEIAAGAFNEIFHALQYGDRKRKVFHKPPPDDDALMIFCRRAEFFTELPAFLRRQVLLPDTAVNTEDNLSSKVIRRNVVRLGLPHDLLESHYEDLDELLNRRNNIAHGGGGDPVRTTDYERLQKSAFQAMDELALTIAVAIENTHYARTGALPPAATP